LNLYTVPEADDCCLSSFMSLTSLKLAVIKTTVFWNVMPCGLIRICQPFRRTCCLHLQSWQ